MLVPLYRARDAFVEPFMAEWEPTRQWGPDVDVRLDESARLGLHVFSEALRSGQVRRYYLHEGAPELSGWWTGRHSGDREYLMDHWCTPEGVVAPVMVASGWQGGVALRDWRHIVDFPVEERAPHKSSNFREASTAAAAVELLGPSHRGERLLLRTDNTTTMSMVLWYKQGTMAPDLWPVCKRMFDSADLYDLDLAAEHIPGVENWLSDGLSRYVRRKDYSDWQYRRDEFESIADMMAMPFTLDGGADLVGTNAHLPRYRSVVDGFTRSPVDGEHVYSNPDYACVREYLEHFLTCQRRSPFETAGTFVLPVWDTYDWWPLLKGAHVLKVYPKGSDLFTSPEWRNLAAGDGAYAFGETVRHLKALVDHLHSELGGPCLCLLGTQHRAHALTCLISRLLSMRTRSSTDTVHARGIRDISFFLGHFGGTTLPATVEEVLGYAGYAVELREFRLDSSSVRTYVSGLSAWHAEMSEGLRACDMLDSVGLPCSLQNSCKASLVGALLRVLDKHYKKPSAAKSCWTLVQWVTIYRYGFVLRRRSGRHHRLLFVFCTVGCLRPTGTR
ncbi:hypothetical protein CYMTET_21508 [Cymbomonas tetramitiformis]|uniref:Uncharacterized protein n=1 Tax=Cymbomonas tetramitiformis TaxID=36881 RepID=A0AAE0G219_9CHLO|nr:hypothetical protein CYMTET_21508 [Cymbomonas tetramitiformis]